MFLWNKLELIRFSFAYKKKNKEKAHKNVFKAAKSSSLQLKNAGTKPAYLTLIQQFHLLYDTLCN